MTKEMIYKLADSYNHGKVDEKNRANWNKWLSDVLQFGDYMLGIGKTAVEKNFCFSYDEYQDCHCGTNTYEEANKMADNVEYNYFLEKNLKEENRYIEMLESDEKIFFLQNYYHNNEIVCLCAESNKISDEAIAEVTDEQRALILTAWKKAKEEKIKRCATWWKKYGKEHLRTWTYSCWD